MRHYQLLLATYLRPLWRQVGVLLLLLLSITGLRLLNPLLLARFIDAAVGGGAWAELVRLAVLFLAVAVVTQLLSVGEAYLATNIGLVATNQLRADLALHCLQLDMTFHNNRTPGELIERIDGDVGHLNNFFARFVVDLLGSLFLLVGVLFALFRIDWRVGLALSVFALATLWVTYRLRNVAIPYFGEARQASAELFGFLEERLSGTEDVRASGAVAYVMRRFYERARLLLRKHVKAHVLSTGVYCIMLVLFALGTILALGLGIYLFLGGLVTIGLVYLIFRYTELLTQPIEQIGRQLHDLQLAGAAILRIDELLRTQSVLRAGGTARLPDQALAVAVEGVSFAYAAGASPGATVSQAVEFALRDLSFDLAPGAVLGLLGRTSSGKTTLTRLLLRLYDPTTGEIVLGGVPLAAVCAAQLHQRVCIVTQEIQLFHATVRDNLTLFAPDIPDARIVAALHELGLGAWYAGLAAGLDTKLAPGGSGLSAGEAQLLAFVCAFLYEPGLVILDEASSRLDPATDRLLAGRTAIIIAHRLATVGRADQIIVLKDGCIEDEGKLEELLARCSEMRRLWHGDGDEEA